MLVSDTDEYEEIGDSTPSTTKILKAEPPSLRITPDAGSDNNNTSNTIANDKSSVDAFDELIASSSDDDEDDDDELDEEDTVVYVGNDESDNSNSSNSGNSGKKKNKKATSSPFLLRRSSSSKLQTFPMELSPNDLNAIPVMFSVSPGVASSNDENNHNHNHNHNNPGSDPNKPYYNNSSFISSSSGSSFSYCSSALESPLPESLVDVSLETPPEATHPHPHPDQHHHNQPQHVIDSSKHDNNTALKISLSPLSNATVYGSSSPESSALASPVFYRGSSSPATSPTTSPASSFNMVYRGSYTSPSAGSRAMVSIPLSPANSRTVLLRTPRDVSSPNLLLRSSSSSLTSLKSQPSPPSSSPPPASCTSKITSALKVSR